MGKITDYIASLITQQIKDYGIVVWYDPERSYTDLIENLALPKTTVLRYESSFFHLREKIEPFLEFVNPQGKVRSDCRIPPNLLVYLPLNRMDTGNALVEIESSGVILEPGASPWQRNTRLRLIAEQVFKKIAPDSALDIGRQAEEGILTLKDLDRLSEEAAGISTGTIKIIFGTASITDVVLSFAASDSFDHELMNKKALLELTAFVEAELGITLDPQKDLGEIRKTLWTALQLSELLANLSPKQKPTELSAILLPSSKGQTDRIRHLVQNWRNRTDLRESYVRAAKKIEADLNLSILEFPLEKMTEVETFPFLEKKLIAYVEQNLNRGKAEKVLPIIEKRRSSFWSLQEPALQLQWPILENCARIVVLSERIGRELKKAKSPEEIVGNYIDGIEPWSQLDRFYRHLEARYSNFDLDLQGQHDELEEVIRLVRQTYNKITEQMIEIFTGLLKNNDFHIPGYLAQREIYGTQVKPLIHKGQKTAYVLVDALRFEMGKELVEGLAEEFEINLFPGIAQLPTITSVGMVALMPKAEKGIKLREGTGGKIAVELEGETSLKDRLARIKHFEDVVEKKVAVFKLNDLMKPSKKQKDAIEEAEVVLITSQEIDRWAEELDEENEARMFMEEVLEKLRKGVRRLASLGVSHFVVTADHGHLFGETLDQALKMDPPGGKTLELHRRIWIGRGGATAEGFFRIAANAVGLEGDFELAFPRGMACFKTKGGSLAYFHGGISPQEMIIPVISLATKAARPYLMKTRAVHLNMEKPKISTRFFSIIATYHIEGLQLGPDEIRIKVAVRGNRKDIGFVAMAAYGYEEGTKEVVLQKDKPNPLTCMITDITGISELSVHILDAVSLVELAKKESIPLTITL
jgi:hypothetical protein